LARCAQCGGSLAAHTRSHGGQRADFYGCLTFWKKGASKCVNNLAASMALLDAEVLATLQEDILQPTVIERAVAPALEALSPGGSADASQADDQPHVRTSRPNASAWPTPSRAVAGSTCCYRRSGTAKERLRVARAAVAAHERR